MDDAIPNGPLVLNENQREGTVTLPGCELALTYKPKSEKAESTSRNKGKPRKEESYTSLETIGELLLKGFDVQDLLDFCFYNPDFSRIYEDLLKSRSEKREIIRQILHFAQQRGKVDAIIQWALTENLDMCERYGFSKAFLQKAREADPNQV